MVMAFILRFLSILTTVEFSVLLAVGFMVFAHPLDFRKRALVTRDEFVRCVNTNSMARSWRFTQYLILALLFGSVLKWIDLTAIWVLIIVSVFMTFSYVVFMIPMFNKGDVE